MKRSSIIMVLTIILAGSFFLENPITAESETARTDKRMRMVDILKIGSPLSRPVLEALRTVPRHRFVPEEYRDWAYEIRPLPIGHKQTISAPDIVAIMTDYLQIDSADTVLEIGTGSGYQAAVLAEIVDHVYTIEIVEPLAERARHILDTLGYDNVTVRAGDGYVGWPEHAPFNAIIVTAAPPKIPQPLKDQLAEGGRMVIPVGTDYQELLLLEKIDGEIKQTPIVPVRFVPMTGDSIMPKQTED